MYNRVVYYVSFGQLRQTCYNTVDHPKGRVSEEITILRGVYMNPLKRDLS